MIKRGFTNTESCCVVCCEMPQSLSLLLSRSLIRSFPLPEAIWLPITSRSVTPCTTERSRHTISNRNGLWITHPSDRASLCPLSYLLNNCSRGASRHVFLPRYRRLWFLHRHSAGRDGNSHPVLSVASDRFAATKSPWPSPSQLWQLSQIHPHAR